MSLLALIVLGILLRFIKANEMLYLQFRSRRIPSFLIISYLEFRDSASLRRFNLRTPQLSHRISFHWRRVV